MQFDRIRLSGFKSFVDPTELRIEPGLTGVVGPNGCGKSNMVEALRWVMGETAPKRLRGDEMEDVIFGGTEERPPRNVAEVVVALDNRARRAPAAFNDFEDIEVTRRIERDKGSIYRINGREVRARDVQLLFADAVTGARSTAIVSQGRIGAIIAAKPAERRLLLEEAAGITGLHSRRHEAELRLRAAETNLERLEDIVGALDVQLQNLNKQARQATRYRNLSDHIRRAEATVLHLRWLAGTGELDEAWGRLAAAESRVAAGAGRAAAASREQAESAAGLPALRKAEVDAAAHLQRLVLAREGLDAEAERVEAAEAGLETRIRQAAADGEREARLAADADTARRRLEEEQARLEAERGGEEDARAEAEAALAQSTHAVRALEERRAALTEHLAAAAARRSGAERAIVEFEERCRRLDERRDEIERRRRALPDADAPALLEATDDALAGARAGRDAARSRATAAEAARAEAAEAAAAAAADLNRAEAAHARLEAEAAALARVLERPGTGLWPPLIDAVAVEPGYEAALGAALGDDLEAPADEPAVVHWLTLDPYPDPAPLPPGVRPLSGWVRAPAALARRLSQVGVVADDGEGDRLRHHLRQGQRLVSRDGALWRWDGYTAAAGAGAAAERLRQANRLAEVRREMAEARARLDAAAAAESSARTATAAAAEAARAARAGADDAEAEHGRVRDVLAEAKERAAARASQAAALADALAGVEADLADAEAGLARARAALAEAPDPAGARREMAALRAQLDARHEAHLDNRRRLDAVRLAAETRVRRLEVIAGELRSWDARGADAGRRLRLLEERAAALEEEKDRLARRPGEIEAERHTLLESLDAAAQRRRDAADRLAEAETRMAEADRLLRAIEAELATAREEMVRAEGAVEQRKQAVAAIAERIAETLQCVPSELPEIAALKQGAPLPEPMAAERRLERLQRERETMGPVNLRAEQEARALGEQIDTLGADGEDLIAAIAKLRQGIAQLNREGRERLMASFNQVDAHFRELFAKLFGGGEAHLTLVEADDPLEAGLEIMASPPGKRLQVLSLLSGGEQALTAIALLFAVFLTNPAPICVLDEVDAPLDDANVDRFCTLVSEIAHAGETRFLVITHHRMTMARMDRLFGVTMSQRGVSQLVSVDLAEAEELRATA